MWRGGLGSAYRFPALSAAGDSLVGGRSTENTCLFLAALSLKKNRHSITLLYIFRPDRLKDENHCIGIILFQQLAYRAATA
jgi:hypothetical protein